MLTAQLLASLSCALTLLIAMVDAQSLCTSDSYGSKIGIPVPLADSSLKPGESTWKVTIPIECDTEMGVEVTVCDYDEPPELHVVSLQSALVVRKGSLNGYARVSTVVYCSDTPKPIKIVGGLLATKPLRL